MDNQGEGLSEGGPWLPDWHDAASSLLCLQRPGLGLLRDGGRRPRGDARRPEGGLMIQQQPAQVVGTAVLGKATVPIVERGATLEDLRNGRSG